VNKHVAYNPIVLLRLKVQNGNRRFLSDLATQMETSNWDQRTYSWKPPGYFQSC